VGEGSKIRRGNVVAFSVAVDDRGRVVATPGGEEQLVLCCEGVAAEARAIQESVSATVADRFGLAVREVVVVPPATLPRTSSGKPRRRETRQLYLDGALSRTDRASTMDVASAEPSR